MRVGLRSFAVIAGGLVACAAATTASQATVSGEPRFSALPRPVSQPASGYQATAQGIPTLSQLLANFAVLRRRQTAADRSWRPPPAGSYARSLPRLTRLARALPNGPRIFLTVERYTGPGWPSVYPLGSYELDVHIVYASHEYDVSTNFGPNVQYTVFPLSSVPPGPPVRHEWAPTIPTWASIIPNGVSRVRCTFRSGRWAGVVLRERPGGVVSCACARAPSASGCSSARAAEEQDRHCVHRAGRSDRRRGDRGVGGLPVGLTRLSGSRIGELADMLLADRGQLYKARVRSQ